MNESSVTTGSKRSALRFHFKEDHPVSYRTAYKDGEGYLVDISTSGCSVRQPSQPIAVDEKLLLSFALQNPEEPLEIQAICVRLNGNGFAVRFLGIDAGDKTRFVKLFAEQARAKQP